MLYNTCFSTVPAAYYQEYPPATTYSRCYEYLYYFRTRVRARNQQNEPPAPP